MSHVLNNYASLDPRSVQAMLSGNGDAREVKISVFASMLSKIKGRPVSFNAAARLLSKMSENRLVVKLAEAARLSYRHPALGNSVLLVVIASLVAGYFL